MARGSRRSVLASVAFVVALARSIPVAASPPSLPDDDTSLPAPPVAHPFGLTLLEEIGALAVQGAWYWGHSRYGSTGADVTPENFIHSLVSDEFVLDDDLFRTNGVGHPIAGAVAYQIARGNGMSVGTSFLASVLASVAWKYFGEWNQAHSTNDLLISPVAGWVIGEATYRVGRWFAAGEPGIFNCIGATALSPFAVINGSTVCRFRNGDRTSSTDRSPDVAPPGRGGWTVGHELQRRGLARRDRDWPRGAHQGERPIPQPGHRFIDGLAGTVELRPRAPARRGQRDPGHRLRRRRARGRAVRSPLRGDGRRVWRYERLERAVRARSSFDYEGRELPMGWDRTAAAGILGPAIEVSARRGPLHLRGWLATTYAFSQVTSLAYAQASASFAGVELKQVLQKEGYYYAHGPVSSAVLEAEVGSVRIALEGRVANFWSIDSDYSNQSQIENNFSLRDTRVFTRAIASLRPLGGPLRLALEFDDDLRDSRIPGTAVRSNERRFLASVALVSR